MDRKISLKPDDDHINGGAADRLSALPDVLLAEILSFLPIKSAAVTSALSHRWRRLWTQTAGHLLFSCFEHPTRSSGFPHKVDEVFITVDRILRQLTSPNVRNFHLNLPYSTNSHHVRRYCSYFESWVCRICGRNPHKITVTTHNYRDSPFVPLPTRLFQCESLEELVLNGRFGFDYDVSNCRITISLPNLKELDICLYDDHHHLMATLFKSCPSLKYLVLYIDWMEDDHVVDISSPNLKRLTLSMKNETPSNEILIDAPKLESVDFVGYITTFCRFVKIPSGLLKARIVLLDRRGGSKRGEDYVKQTLELFRGVSSVRSLDMYAPNLNSLDYVDANLLPKFHNMTRLNIHVRWKDFMRFLQWYPNLENVKFRNDDDPVILEGVVDPVPVCFLSKLKRMEIVTQKGCSEALLDFLRYVLSEASVLEQLLINVCNHKESKLSNELKFCEDLFSHPRSSLTCKIEFFGLQRLSS